LPLQRNSKMRPTIVAEGGGVLLKPQFPQPISDLDRHRRGHIYSNRANVEIFYINRQAETRFLLRCMSPFMARSRHAGASLHCPLPRVNRTYHRTRRMSASKATFSSPLVSKTCRNRAVGFRDGEACGSNAVDRLRPRKVKRTHQSVTTASFVRRTAHRDRQHSGGTQARVRSIRR